jgi:hypothetical protein
VNVFQQRGNVGMVLRVIPTKIRTMEELYLPKVLEKITMLESAVGRGIMIERVPFEEQLARGAAELKANEGLARSEGITPEDPTRRRLV